MTDPIYITGTGVVSAIGLGKVATLEALLTNRSGVGPLRYLKTAHKEFPVGEVKLTDAEMAEIAGLNKGTRYYTRTDEALAGFALWQPAYEAE